MSSGEASQPTKDKFYEFKPFRVPKYRIEFQQAGKLADVPGYVWYTPAMLYLWGRYSETNLADAVQRHDLRIFWYRFDKPVFSGFTANGDPAWNHTLCAVQEEQWPKLVDSVLETVQFDIPNATLYQYALQKLTLPDPLTLDTQRLLLADHPTQLVHAFAVLTNERQIAFDTRNAQVSACPSVVRFKPDPLHVRAADRLFARSGLTQDQAFESYKQIMVQEQDENYQQRVSKQKESK
jgi:hypothetical protein